MSKQIQDAYIVAATRTPIGKSHKGYFRNTRPDDLLAAVLRSALAAGAGAGPGRHRGHGLRLRHSRGAAGPERGARGRGAGGAAQAVGGITVNRFCASGLSAVQMAADRIRVGEAEVMVAAGVESMSMVPMMGNKPSLSPAVFERRRGRLGIAYGMGLTAEKVAQQWKVSREAQDAFALQSHQRAVAASRPASSRTRSRPSR
jgi:acetyl-CoA acyltransferase